MNKGKTVFWMFLYLLVLGGGNWTWGSTLLCYYDGPIYSALSLDYANSALALQVTPPAYPSVVDSVQIYIISEGDTIWPPLGDTLHEPFQISLFNDGGGVPGMEVFRDTVVADSIPPSWVKAYPNVIITSGDFWVAFVSLTNLLTEGGEFVATDSFLDFEQQHWFRDTFGIWQQLFSFSGDMMICAYVSSLPGVEEGNNEKLEISNAKFKLLQNNPNPFHHSTLIRYSLSASGRTSLKIYDITGRIVETLVDESKEPGVYQVEWEGKDQASGIYFYRLQARIGQVGDFTSTRKLILLK
jgi:hypothetical protein